MNSESINVLTPLNVLSFLSFYSPILVVTFITSLSLIFQNFKGFIYLGFLLGVCWIRGMIYNFSGVKPVPMPEVCNKIMYTSQGNTTLSMFIFAFTITYLSIPMFSNSDPNYWIFVSMLVYFIFDILIKYGEMCISSMSILLAEILGGSVLSTIIVMLMYAGGSGKYLFFNEITSDKNVCYQPKNQTFKCSVYKNGELVGNI